jgi:hypothetical protein
MQSLAGRRLLALFAAAALAACGGGGSGDDDAASAPAAAGSPSPAPSPAPSPSPSPAPAPAAPGANEVTGGEVAAIDRNDRAAVLSAYRDVFIPASAFSERSVGDVNTCDPGDTSRAYKLAVMRTINYYRAMAGLPGNVLLNLDWSRRAQQAALMMSANNDLDHSPPATWRCHTAEGAQAAGKSNLASTEHVGGGSLFGLGLYMNDTGVDSLGHRRWILYPPQRAMGTGDSAGSGALWVLGPHGSRPATPQGVAWPPAGLVPSPVVRNGIDWSFSMPGANFANAQLQVQQWNGQAAAVEVRLRGGGGYGDPTLSWRWNAGNGRYWPVNTAGDSWFDVTIGNVVIGSQAREFRYRVTLIAP